MTGPRHSKKRHNNGMSVWSRSTFGPAGRQITYIYKKKKQKKKRMKEKKKETCCKFIYVAYMF